MAALLSCAVVVLCLGVLAAHLRRLGRLELRAQTRSGPGWEDDAVPVELSRWAETDRFLLPTLARVSLFMGTALGLIALGLSLGSGASLASAATSFGVGLGGALLIAALGRLARQRWRRIRGPARGRR